LIDDLITNGSSKIEAADKLRAAGLNVRDVVVLIDREGGATESISDAGLQLHSVVTLSRLIDHWILSGAIDERLQADLKKYQAR
jgi:orotate phosphoribosyltransferase